MDYSNQLRRLSGIARWARFLCWAVAAMAILTIPVAYLDLSGAIDFDYGEDALTISALLLYAIYFVAFLASIVCVAIWIYRAQSNLLNLGHEDLKYTPGWAVGWYFIPFANLVVPRTAMGELWEKSHGDDRPPSHSILNWWWGTWLVGNIFDGIGARGVERMTFDALTGGIISGLAMMCTAASATLLARIIGTVTSAQQDGRSASRVFA